MELKGKRAVVTGASAGIGEATAIYLAKEGVNLVLIARRLDKLQKLKETLSKYNVGIDVRNKEVVHSVITEYLKDNVVDILINSAGLASGADPIYNGDYEDWDKMIDTNIKGLLYISKPIIQHMKERNIGDIVNLGSVAGIITYPNGSVYCASKSAVHSISEGMNIDLLGTMVRVSNIAPGAIETEFAIVRFHGDEEKAKKVYEGYTPLSANDIADLILYILKAPAHVSIQNALIMPTVQRNPYVLDRK
jgi:hypothetical protein